MLFLRLGIPTFGGEAKWFDYLEVQIKTAGDELPKNLTAILVIVSLIMSCVSTIAASINSNHIQFQVAST